MLNQDFFNLLDKVPAPVMSILILNAALHNTEASIADRSSPVPSLPGEFAWYEVPIIDPARRFSFHKLYNVLDPLRSRKGHQEMDMFRLNIENLDCYPIL